MLDTPLRQISRHSSRFVGFVLKARSCICRQPERQRRSRDADDGVSPACGMKWLHACSILVAMHSASRVDILVGGIFLIFI